MFLNFINVRPSDDFSASPISKSFIVNESDVNAFPIYLQAGEHKPAQPIQWEWDPRWYKSTTKRRYYIKAAALLVAEIERLDRQTAKS